MNNKISEKTLNRFRNALGITDNDLNANENLAILYQKLRKLVPIKNRLTSLMFIIFAIDSTIFCYTFLIDRAILNFTANIMKILIVCVVFLFIVIAYLEWRLIQIMSDWFAKYANKRCIHRASE